MFCKKCGKEIPENSLFCIYCGEKQIEAEEQDMEMEIPEEKKGNRIKKSMGKGIFVGLFIVCIVAVIGIPAISKQFAKNKSQKEMIADYEKQVEELKETYDHLIVTEEEESLWEDKIQAYDTIEKKVSNYDQIISTYQEVVSYIEEIEQKNKSDMENQLKKLKKKTMLYATASEKEEVKEEQSRMKTEIENSNFQEAQEIGNHIQSLIQATNEKKTGLNIKVVQTDYSEFPNIRLYLDIIDSNGNVVKGIDQDMFFISEKGSGQSNFKNNSIVKAAQLNEKEALSMNLLIDTSGSMEGEPLSAAQNIMNRFINTIQFQAGDNVKLTSFNSFIDRETEFMTDTSSLSEILYSLEANGGTKLYDTLIYAVQDTAVQSGAKCVIAFTDGFDEGSLNSVDDVVQVARQYGIPIYIVRIGEDFGYGEKESLIEIAEQSGGKFYTEIGFNDSVENIYYQIYRDLKQYYVVEYTAQSDYSISDEMEYEVYVRSGEMGGNYAGEYTASEDVFENLYWNFLQAYIYDMNNHRYDKLDDYIEANVDVNDKNAYYLYNQMRTQVSGGFANVESENLISAQIYDIKKKSDDLYLLYTREEYDTLYLQTYEELKGDTASGKWKLDQKSANKALEILGQSYDTDMFYDDDVFAIWKVIYQQTIYQVKRSSDGKWKFYKYDKAIDFYKDPEVYFADYYH